MQGLVPPGPISRIDGVVFVVLSLAGLTWVLVWLIRTARKRKLEGANIFRGFLFGAVLFFFLAMGVHAILWVHVPFPEIHDWNSLRITLTRSGCFGTSPTYKIEIHGDGTVSYDGKANVATMGRQTGKISHASLVELVDVFRKADYFSLSERYVSGVTDNPTYVSSISFDGVSKSVLDYVGRDAGMPSTVSDVETAIDRLSGSYKWIGR